MKKEVYIPTKKEIEAECAKIRETWSELTKQSRLRFDWRKKFAFTREVELPAMRRLKPEIPD